MRKLISVLLALLLCFGTCAYATSSTGNATVAIEAETTASDTIIEGMENTIPAVGDSIAGFTVVKEEPFDTYDGILVTLTHEKSGGTVVWIANDDTERSFVIGFRTHDNTDTGLPHVFEHAACSGSKKYTDSGMATSMMTQTYSTYINASTFTNCTDFEVASLSDEQLVALADYMLAGVFEPLVLTDEHAMMREAYRYELWNADSDITLTGTVYSEMQGAYYSNAQAYTLMKQLFPGSWHSACTGGKPGVIEEMTQQDLIDFHDTYYVPSNAISMLYGDLNLSDFLELIGSYYDNYDKAEVSTDDPGYEPFTGYSRVDCDIPASAGDSAGVTLDYAMPVRGYDETDTYMLTAFLSIAISNDSSAFNKLMMEKFPSAKVTVTLQNDGDSAEPMLIFEMQNAGNIVPEDFVAAVKEGIAADLEEGIKTEVLKTALKNFEKTLLTAREGSHVGISVSENLLLQSFAEYGDASVCITNLNALLNEGEEWLSEGVLEEAMKAAAAPENSRLVVLTTVPGLLDQINEESAQKLADKKAAMSEEEIQALIDSTAEFKAWQDAEDDVSQIDEVRVVTVSELPEEIKVYTAEDSTEDGIRYVTSDTGDDRLVTMTLYFDASGIAAEDLTRYAALANDLLGTLPTTEHTYDEVSLIVGQYGISFEATVLVNNNNPDDYRPVLAVTVDCMREEIADGIDAAWEILTQTQFSENDLIRYTLAASGSTNRYTYGTLVGAYQTFIYEEAGLSDYGRYTFEIKYTPYYKYDISVGNMDDTALAAEEESWQNMLSALVNKENLAVTVVSGEECIEETLSALKAYTDTLTAREITAADYSTLTPISKSMAITIGGSINYNMKAIRLEDAGIEYSGSLEAISGLVTDKILTPVMRHRNGVYSPLSEFDNRAIYAILAYRDPSISTTYDEVIPSLGDELRNMEITQEELDSYIISAYSKLAMPLGPITGAQTAVMDVLTGSDTFADKKADMESLRNLTPDDLQTVAALYDALNEKGNIYTAGPATAIEAEKSRFDTVETWYTADEE